jgi:hypothetical protein
METSTIIASVFGFVLTLVSGLIISKVNRTANKQEAQDKAITTLQNTAVSDSHVRKIVKEELQPLTLTLDKVVTSLHNIEVYVAEDKGYKAGRRAMSNDVEK